MTRARDQARRLLRPPLRRRPRSRRPPVSLTAVVLAGLLAVAGCGSQVVSPLVSGAPASGTNAAGASAPTGGGPSPTTADASSPGPSDSPPATGADAGSPGPAGTGPAAGCSGTAANREFFASVAAAVTWSVYCAVVPDGWFVESGSYRLRSGGQMIVAYRGPSGARLELREGAFCADAGGCVPSGEPTGQAPFGDRSGTFVEVDGGGFAVAVDAGQPVAWLAIGANLDEPTFRGLAGALRLVPAS